MKRKIATLIMLIVLFIISVTGITIISINTFGNNEPMTEPIEYPIWLDESFYESNDVNRETALEERITDFYKEYETIDPSESPMQISFIADWFIHDFENDTYYLNVDSYDDENILDTWIEPKKDIDATIIINNVASIDLGNVSNINNSIIGSKELLIGDDASTTLTINDSIIYSTSTSVFAELSKYESVDINNSLIISDDFPIQGTGIDLSNINISNSVICGTTYEDHLSYSNEYAHKIDEYYGLNIDNVYYDNLFERFWIWFEGNLPK